MSLTVEKISAVTLRVSNMKASVQFYRDVLGMELLYGGEGAFFSSLRAEEADSARARIVADTPDYAALCINVNSTRNASSSSLRSSVVLRLTCPQLRPTIP